MLGARARLRRRLELEVAFVGASSLDEETAISEGGASQSCRESQLPLSFTPFLQKDYLTGEIGIEFRKAVLGNGYLFWRS
jgi:hypothetical protein